MPATLTVAYPVDPPEFDHAYYATSHLPLLLEVMRPLGLEDASVSHGIAGGGDRPPPWHAVSTLIFPDLETLKTALEKGERAFGDTARFYKGRPEVMIGETLI